MDRFEIQRPSQLVRRACRAFPLVAAVCLAAVGCSESPSERRAAVYELRAEPTERNVERIRALLGDEDRDVRATALNALVGLRVDDAPQLALAALDDPDGFVRATAAKLAADVDVAEALPRLVELLRVDGDPVVRQRAAESLTRFGGEPALAALAEALGDPTASVRLAAVTGLRRTAPGAVVEPLSRIALDDEVWEIRVQAVEALGRTTSPRAGEVLREVAQDDNEFVRAAAAHALRVHLALGAERSK